MTFSNVRNGDTFSRFDWGREHCPVCGGFLVLDLLWRIHKDSGIFCSLCESSARSLYYHNGEVIPNEFEIAVVGDFHRRRKMKAETLRKYFEKRRVE